MREADLANRCLQCGTRLPLFRKVTGGEFCCEEHRLAYTHEQSNLALSRLIDEQPSVQAARKPRRRGIALPLPRTANGNGANGNASHGKSAQASGQDPAFCQWLYATPPRTQNYRSRLRAGHSWLSWSSELTLPAANWRILRKRLMMGASLDAATWLAARGGAGALWEGEGAGSNEPMAAPVLPGMGRLDSTEWSAGALAAAPECEQAPAGQAPPEPASLAALMRALHPVALRDWTAPMRSSLPKPWKPEPWTPALPVHAEARVRFTLNGELDMVRTAPLIRNSRILGKGVVLSNGHRPVSPEHRVWESIGALPQGPQSLVGEHENIHSLSSLPVLAARGSRAALSLLEGDPVVNSRPVLPLAPPAALGMRLTRARRVAIPTIYSEAGRKPLPGRLANIFPLPFLVPPLPPRIGEASVRTPVQGLRALTLAPRRGVESYQVSVPAPAPVALREVPAQRPVADLKPVLDWITAFGRPVAPSWEFAPHTQESRRAAGEVQLAMAAPPVPAVAVLAPEPPRMPQPPLKLMRLTLHRVEMQRWKPGPMAFYTPHTPEREAIKPRAKLEPRTLALHAQGAGDTASPVWRRKLDQASEAWRRLPAAPKWGGMLVAALALAVGLGTSGSYTTEARAPRTSVPEMMPGVSHEGGLAGLHKTILNRAAIALTDDFRAGLADWEGQGDWARSWSYDSVGFVRTGALAFYTPTMRLTDYRLEFLGQIEKRSLSWVVRAKDSRNFYAIKITLRDDGPVPSAYLQRYAVIDGHPAEAVQKRLPMQVTPDTLYRVLMETRGPNYVLTVQGQIVDSWTEHRLQSGGVGFFSAKGELARLRWVGVWHQYDALGRLCAFLAPYSISDRERSGGQ